MVDSPGQVVRVCRLLKELEEALGEPVSGSGRWSRPVINRASDVLRSCAQSVSELGRLVWTAERRVKGMDAAITEINEAITKAQQGGNPAEALRLADRLKEIELFGDRVRLQYETMRASADEVGRSLGALNLRVETLQTSSLLEDVRTAIDEAAELLTVCESSGVEKVSTLPARVAELKAEADLMIMKLTRMRDSLEG